MIATIAEYVGFAISLITLSGLIVKPIRRVIVKWLFRDSELSNLDDIHTIVKSLKDDMTVIQDKMEVASKTDLHILGKHIMEVYDKYIDDEYIPLDVKDFLIMDYDQYKKLGGNGKISMRYAELMKKKTCKNKYD